MFEPTADILKTIAVVLGVLLPALLGWAVYRREDYKLQKQGPQAAIRAIGAGLLTEATAERAMQAAREHADSIGRLARAIEIHNDEHSRFDEIEKRIFDQLCDEITAARRALEEIKTAALRAAEAVERSTRRSH